MEEGPIAATLKEACKQLGVEEEGTLPARAASCLEVIGVSDQNTGPGNGSVEQPQAAAEGGSDRDGGIESLGTKRSRPTAAVAVNHLSEKRSRYESGAATDDGAPAAHDGTSAQALAPAAPLALTDQWGIQEKDDVLVPEHARESPASNLL